MSHITLPPPVPSDVEAELQQLYLRRSAIDRLIHALQVYEQMSTGGERSTLVRKSSQLAGAGNPLRRTGTGRTGIRLGNGTASL